MSKNELRSKMKISNFIIVIPFGIIALVAAYFMVTNSLKDEYPDILSLIFGCLFGLIGVGCLGVIFFLEKIVLKDNKLIIQSLFGRRKKVINFSEIISYSEIEKEGRNTKWKDLTLFTKDSKYMISSTLYSNYDDLEKRLTRGKKKNTNAKKRWKNKLNRRYGYGFLIAGIIFTLILGNMFIKRNNEVLPNELSRIEGTISDEILIKKSGKRGENISMPIRLEEFPKFKFEVKGYGVRSTNTSQFISDIKKGDRIQLEILTDQYKKKLAKEIPLSFLDKGFNFREIIVYGIKAKNENYFDLENYNNLKTSDRNSIGMYALLAFSISLIGYGIRELFKSKKSFSKK